MSTIKVDSIKSADGNTDLLTLSSGAVSGVNLGRRNLIINGAMQVWQRGTSFSSAVNGQYVVDRGQTFGSGMTCVVDRSTDVPANQGFKYSFRVNRTASGLPVYRQRIEDFSTLISGRQVTLSFWAKADAATDVDVDIGDNDAAKATFSLTTSWQRFTHTYDAYSSYTFDALDIQNNTVSTTMYFTGVQLEVGSVATPFEHRSYGEELALCQRYYQVSGDNIQNGFDGTVSVGMLTTGQIEKGVKYPVKLRAAPTLTFIDGNGNTGKVSRLYPGVAWNDNSSTSVSNNSDTGHWSYSSSGNNGASLLYRWIADAEL